MGRAKLIESALEALIPTARKDAAEKLIGFAEKDAARVDELIKDGLTDFDMPELGPADVTKPMRLYHGTTNIDPLRERGGLQGFDFPSPDMQPHELGLHVGTPKQANFFAANRHDWDELDYTLNKDYFKTATPSNSRVIPLDVEVRNPIRLEDRTGSWRPTEIYKQLYKGGTVPYDHNTYLDLHVWENSSNRNERTKAMKVVRQLIEDAGYDGAVYTNRVEGHGVGRGEVYDRFEQRGIEQGGLPDKEWLDVVPEAQGNDSYILWNKDKYRSPFGDGEGVGFADGGLVDRMDFTNIGKPKFADGGPVWSEEDIASMTHDKSYGVGMEPSTLKAFGEEYDLGDGPVYYREGGERYAPQDNLQDIYDLKTVPFYATPAAPIAAASDFAEGMLSGDPTTMALSVAGGIPGKVYKAGGKLLYETAKKPIVAGTAAVAAGTAANTDEAEAGLYGTMAKWAKSPEGKGLLREAEEMYFQGVDPVDIQRQTGWRKDHDGHWKFELPDTGASADVSNLPIGRSTLLRNVYENPNLFDQYPGLDNTVVERINGVGGAYSPTTGNLKIGSDDHPFFRLPETGGLKGIFDHELYHKKANMERWAQGSNTKYGKDQTIEDMRRFLKSKSDREYAMGGKMSDLMNAAPDQYEAMSHGRYWHDIGETLARREAARGGMSKAEIAAKPFYGDLDIPANSMFDKDTPADPEQYRAMIKETNERMERFKKLFQGGN